MCPRIKHIAFNQSVLAWIDFGVSGAAKAHNAMCAAKRVRQIGIGGLR